MHFYIVESIRQNMAKVKSFNRKMQCKVTLMDFF